MTRSFVSTRSVASTMYGAVALAALSSGMPYSRSDPVIVNGSLTGPIVNNGVPPGWSVSSGSPDTMDENNNVGVPSATNFCVPPSGASPDGGTWVGLGTTLPIERFGQTVGGFEVSAEYEISWYQGNFGLEVLCTVFGPGQNAIQVRVDSQVVGAGTFVAPGPAWTSESVTFVAASETMLIEFEVADQLSSGYVSIDGISIRQVAGARYCTPANLNSTGVAAVLLATGSTLVSDNDIRLAAVDLPQNQFGYFLSSPTQGFIANPAGSQGNFCLGGGALLGRYDDMVMNSGPAGTFAAFIDLTAVPIAAAPGSIAIQPGDTWNFQAWFRDVPNTSNFTDAVSIQFD
ncbi:MAG: hypothetical protein GY711_24920 [bacterium]|nr:hypothetical protein [bacterium]